MYDRFQEELRYMRKYVGKNGLFNKINIKGYADSDDDANESILVHRGKTNYAPIYDMLETQLIAHIIRSEVDE